VTRRQLGLPDPSVDLDDRFCLWRDNLGRSDAFVTSAEYVINGRGSATGDEGGGDFLRRRDHIAYLIESAELAVRAAVACRSSDVFAIKRRA
jgi:hypothetical protein